MNNSVLAQLSRDLEIPKQRIVDEGIQVFLEKELRNAGAEVVKLRSELQVKNTSELKSKIENGKIAEHPAWEQLMYWENLNNKVKVVKSWMRKLSTQR